MTQKDQFIVINIHAQPGAKRSAVVGLYGEKLKVAIATPPVDGKANKAIIAFLAKTISCPKSKLEIIAGETSREKRIRINEMTADAVIEALTPPI